MARETSEAPPGIACVKSRLTQVSCVGAHSRAPYKSLINRGSWAHSRLPLQDTTQDQARNAKREGKKVDQLDEH